MINQKLDIENICLASLTVQHTDSLYALVQANKSHLTQLGDYEDYVKKSKQELLDEINKSFEQIGIFESDQLIGLISLTEYQPKVIGLGYWLDQSATGRGIMFQVLRAVIDELYLMQVKEIWAGISHPNVASQRLVQSLGFKLAREQVSHLSYCLVSE